MAVGITEDQKSRSIDMSNGGGKSTRVYTLRDYTEADDAYKALRDYAPDTIWIAGFQLNRQGVKVTPEFSDPEQTIYRGDVSYASPTMAGTTPNKGGGGGGGAETDQPNAPVGAEQDPEKEPVKEEDPSKIWFTFGTRSKRIIQVPDGAKSTRLKRLRSGDWELKNGYRDINRDADDVAPEGVDVQEGTMFVHVTVVLKSGKLSLDFYRDALEAQMAVNKETFGYGFRPGTMQFQGIDIEDMVKGDVKVTYHFEIRKMVDVATFSTSISGETQRLHALEGQNFEGFDYTWLSYQDVDIQEEEEGQKSYSRRVDSINLSSVYPRIDFSSNQCLKWCSASANGGKKWKN